MGCFYKPGLPFFNGGGDFIANGFRGFVFPFAKRRYRQTGRPHNIGNMRVGHRRVNIELFGLRRRAPAAGRSLGRQKKVNRLLDAGVNVFFIDAGRFCQPWRFLRKWLPGLFQLLKLFFRQFLLLSSKQGRSKQAGNYYSQDCDIVKFHRISF